MLKRLTVFGTSLFLFLWSLPARAQEETTDGPLTFISEGFNRSLGIHWTTWVIVFVSLFLILGGVYGIVWVINRQSGSLYEGRGKVTILEALQRNVQLSKPQSRYLNALIEKFKNRNPYEPEVSTTYLKEFLEFSIHNLTHAPKQRIKRSIHRVPDFTVGHHIELMVEIDDEYQTLSYEITGQDENYVTLKPKDQATPELRENDSVEISYRKGNLYLRGYAEIRQQTGQELILYLPKGLHFEEQRAYQRIDTNSIPCKLSLKAKNKDPFGGKGKMEDISAEGAQILVETNPENLAKNMRGTINFVLPGFQEMTLFTEVVRKVDHGNELVELGLHFTRVNMGDRERIFQFIRRKEQENIESSAEK